MSTYFTSDIERLREAKKLEPDFYAKYKRKLILFTVVRWGYIIYSLALFLPIYLPAYICQIFLNLVRKFLESVDDIIDVDRRLNLRRYISRKNKEYYKNLEESNK